MSFRDKGEEIAAAYLRGKGYKILAGNYNGKGFEIDLIARKERLIAFVEVKRRKSSDFMDPLLSIGKKRKEHMIKGAKVFLLENDLYDKYDVRFDIVTIIGNKENIEHYEDAFRIEK
ncbi:YraN family protein [candidate division WOR-3 bacterium]|nr:YraN family protein [candidate division WOR-3 bacterium]